MRTSITKSLAIAVVFCLQAIAPAEEVKKADPVYKLPEPIELEVLELKDGRTFERVKIHSVETSKVRFSHSGGVAGVHPMHFPSELSRQLGEEFSLLSAASSLSEPQKVEEPIPAVVREEEYPKAVTRLENEIDLGGGDKLQTRIMNPLRRTKGDLNKIANVTNVQADSMTRVWKWQREGFGRLSRKDMLDWYLKFEKDGHEYDWVRIERWIRLIEASDLPVKEALEIPFPR